MKFDLSGRIILLVEPNRILSRKRVSDLENLGAEVAMISSQNEAQLILDRFIFTDVLAYGYHLNDSPSLFERLKELPVVVGIIAPYEKTSVTPDSWSIGTFADLLRRMYSIGDGVRHQHVRQN